jgi:predicted RNA methylase
MAARPDPPPDDERCVIDRASRRRTRLVAAALRSGRRSADDAFDRFLPPALREVSSQYWTPLPVVRQVAVWLRETGVRTVTDIGSGAGKFCVGVALLTRCRVVGLEHRASLVAAARTLAAVFEVDDRVAFIHGGLAAADELITDAYYVFNPFGAYTFSSDGHLHEAVSVSAETHRSDIAAVAGLLSRAARGTVVVTYNGFGGAVPSDYVQIDVVTRLPGTLRLWKKGPDQPLAATGRGATRR